MGGVHVALYYAPSGASALHGGEVQPHLGGQAAGYRGDLQATVGRRHLWHGSHHLLSHLRLHFYLLFGRNLRRWRRWRGWSLYGHSLLGGRRQLGQELTYVLALNSGDGDGHANWSNLSLRPLDVETLADSVRKTHRAVVVEEGWAFCGVGSQIASTLYEEAFDYLDAPIGRVTQADVPIPYNKRLESLSLPNPEAIVQAVKDVCYL